MSELVQRRKAMADEMMRDAICDAAATVLARVGFAALTMERVAEAVDVSKGTLYNYFHDKDTLVLEVIERTFAPMRAEVERVFAEQSDIPGVLVHAVRVILTGLEERRALGQVLCGRELSPVIDADLRDKHLRMQGQFKALFRKAGKAGLLRVSCEHPEELGRFFGLALDGVIEERFLHSPDRPSVEQEVSLIECCLIQPWFKKGKGHP